MKLPDYEYQGAFTQQWTDSRIRGAIVHRFQIPAKQGIKTAQEVVASAVDDALNSLTSKNPEFPRHAKYIATSKTLLAAVQADPQEALSLAAFLIERESWEPEKKFKLRGEQMAFYGDRKKGNAVAGREA